MPIDVGVIAIIGGFSDLALAQVLPHQKIVCHLEGMIALFKMLIFLNHRVDHIEESN